MKFPETREQSAEYLRLVIPLLAKNLLAANPVNYAVCYYYVSGSNKELNAAVDRILEDQGILSAGVVSEFYSKYITAKDTALVEAQNAELARLFAKLADSTHRADEEATQFNHSLQNCGSALEAGLDEFAIHRIVNDLLSGTRSMQNSVSDLQSQLDESQGEINLLRAKLTQTQQQAVTDPLTGLVNRKGFDEAYNRVTSDVATGDNPLCLVLVDIDHFKRVNDTYGHLVGDKVIQIIGGTLKKHVKGKDTVCRFGGEEFAVLLPDTTLEGARSVGEAFRCVVENTRMVRKNSQQRIDPVTISIGIAQLRGDESVENLIGRADAALYESKNQGRNRVTLDQ